MVKSAVKKRSIALRDRKTSVTLENEFWKALKEIAMERRTTITELVNTIEGRRHPTVNLSSAIRLFVLEHYRTIAGS
ncbi:MAG: ribbon-helix-helix domain-containing protein [Xanthobacteraceae bacterium]|jgi:predicted DNA-binding ribbon-helix-helix protein